MRPAARLLLSLLVPLILIANLCLLPLITAIPPLERFIAGGQERHHRRAGLLRSFGVFETCQFRIRHAYLLDVPFVKFFLWSLSSTLLAVLLTFLPRSTLPLSAPVYLLGIPTAHHVGVSHHTSSPDLHGSPQVHEWLDGLPDLGGLNPFLPAWVRERYFLLVYVWVAAAFVAELQEVAIAGLSHWMKDTINILELPSIAGTFAALNLTIWAHLNDDATVAHIAQARARSLTSSHARPYSALISHDLPRSPLISHDLPCSPMLSHALPCSPAIYHDLPRPTTTHHDLQCAPMISHDLPSRAGTPRFRPHAALGVDHVPRHLLAAAAAWADAHDARLHAKRRRQVAGPADYAPHRLRECQLCRVRPWPAPPHPPSSSPFSPSLSPTPYSPSSAPSSTATHPCRYKGFRDVTGAELSTEQGADPDLDSAQVAGLAAVLPYDACTVLQDKLRTSLFFNAEHLFRIALGVSIDTTFECQSKLFDNPTELEVRPRRSCCSG